MIDKTELIFYYLMVGLTMSNLKTFWFKKPSGMIIDSMVDIPKHLINSAYNVIGPLNKYEINSQIKWFHFDNHNSNS
ncbi:unnamed protein product [Heterobilharzia americana]|nr:unnamed protein product [Heterobilharzia americana]